MNQEDMETNNGEGVAIGEEDMVRGEMGMQPDKMRQRSYTFCLMFPTGRKGNTQASKSMFTFEKRLPLSLFKRKQ